jgi:hypothetical protein
MVADGNKTRGGGVVPYTPASEASNVRSLGPRGGASAASATTSGANEFNRLNLGIRASADTSGSWDYVPVVWTGTLSSPRLRPPNRWPLSNDHFPSPLPAALDRQGYRINELSC